MRGRALRAHSGNRDEPQRAERSPRSHPARSPARGSIRSLRSLPGSRRGDFTVPGRALRARETAATRSPPRRSRGTVGRAHLGHIGPARAWRSHQKRRHLFRPTTRPEPREGKTPRRRSPTRGATPFSIGDSPGPLTRSGYLPSAVNRLRRCTNATRTPQPAARPTWAEDGTLGRVALCNRYFGPSAHEDL